MQLDTWYLVAHLDGCRCWAGSGEETHFKRLCLAAGQVISQLSQGKAERPCRSFSLCTLDLSVCPSVGRSVGRSVGMACLSHVVCACVVYMYVYIYIYIHIIYIYDLCNVYVDSEMGSGQVVMRHHGSAIICEFLGLELPLFSPPRISRC